MPGHPQTDDGRPAANVAATSFAPPSLAAAVLACALLACALVACAGGDAPPVVERADSAGIEIVVSGPEGRPLAWSFTERFALGGEEEGPESFYRLVPGMVGADDAGRIHVLDAMSHRVVTFDADGAFVRAFGRQGGGPGEMEDTHLLDVGPDGQVSVFDWGRTALVRWDSAGELLPQVPFPHPPWIEGQHHAVTRDGYLVATGGTVDGERVQRLLRVAGEDTTVLAEVAQPSRGGFVRFERCGGGINFPPLFTPTLVWHHRDGTTAVVPGDDYRIDLWRDGRLVRCPRPLPATAATRELAIAEAGDGFTIDFGRGPCTVPPDEYADARGWAETVPAIRDLILAPDGAVWVQRWVPGADPMPVDVFDADGVYRGTLPEGAELPAVIMTDGRVGVIRTDALDVARLVVGEGEVETDGKEQ